MSSSADSTSSAGIPYGWDSFAERPAPDGLTPVPPGRALATAVQGFRTELDRERQRTRATVTEARRTTVEFAVHLWRLRQLLDEAAKPLRVTGQDGLASRLTLIHQQMTDLLAELHIKAVDPVEQPLDRFADLVDILHWRHESRFTTEVVVQTVVPIVHDDEVVARYGQVVVGAPVEERDNEPVIEPGSEQKEHKETP
ncbi:hypothetical protein [Streptomyces mayteni]